MGLRGSGEGAVLSSPAFSRKLFGCHTKIIFWVLSMFGPADSHESKWVNHVQLNCDRAISYSLHFCHCSFLKTSLLYHLQNYNKHLPLQGVSHLAAVMPAWSCTELELSFFSGGNKISLASVHSRIWKTSHLNSTALSTLDHQSAVRELRWIRCCLRPLKSCCTFCQCGSVQETIIRIYGI